MTMTKSMMAAEQKLTQIAGFFKIEFVLGFVLAGGTTIGNVCGAALVKLLLHKSVLQQQKKTECFCT